MQQICQPSQNFLELFFLRKLFSSAIQTTIPHQTYIYSLHLPSFPSSKTIKQISSTITPQPQKTRFHYSPKWPIQQSSWCWESSSWPHKPMHLSHSQGRLSSTWCSLQKTPSGSWNKPHLPSQKARRLWHWPEPTGKRWQQPTWSLSTFRGWRRTM